jgi:hypothetical protein
MSELRNKETDEKEKPVREGRTSSHRLLSASSAAMYDDDNKPVDYCYPLSEDKSGSLYALLKDYGVPLISFQVALQDVYRNMLAEIPELKNTLVKKQVNQSPIYTYPAFERELLADAEGHICDDIKCFHEGINIHGDRTYSYAMSIMISSDLFDSTITVVFVSSKSIYIKEKQRGARPQFQELVYN